MKTKRFILMILVTLVSVTGAWAQEDKTIRYTATEKLNIAVGSDGIITDGTVEEHEYDPITQEGYIIFNASSATISIKDSGFKQMSNLLSIILPNTVTTIGANAFEGCM